MNEANDEGTATAARIITPAPNRIRIISRAKILLEIAKAVAAETKVGMALP